ncbi:MAG: hypothetical protein ACJAR2_000202 [Ilumatobacter sp.]
MEHREHDRSEPQRREHGSHNIKVRPAPRQLDVTAEASREHDEHSEKYLTHQYPSPGELSGEEAADDRASSDANASNATDHPKGGDAVTQFAASSATSAARTSAAPTPSTTDPPADNESLLMLELQSGLFEISIEQPGWTRHPIECGRSRAGDVRIRGRS